MLPNSNPLPLPVYFASPVVALPPAQAPSSSTAATDPANTKSPATPSANVAVPTNTPLQQLQATTSGASPALPGSSHSESEKKRNIERQKSMKDLGRLETEIGKLERSIKAAIDKKDEETHANLKKSLQQRKKEKAKLIAAIQPELSANSSSKSVSLEEASTLFATDESTGEKLQKLEEEISECNSCLEQAKSEGKEKQTDRLEQKLNDLCKKRDHLKSQLNLSNRDEVSIDISPDILREDFQQVLDDLQECKSSLRKAMEQGREKQGRSLLKEIQELEAERDELASKLEAIDVRKPSTAPFEEVTLLADGDVDPVVTVKRQLRGRIDKITELERMLEKLGGTNANKESLAGCLKEKRELAEEARHLESVLRFLESQNNPDTNDETLAARSTAPAPPVRVASMSRMIHTATTRRRRSSMPASPVETVTVDGSTPLASLNDMSRNSTLLMSGDLKQYFSETALEEITKIDEEIAALANSIDSLYDTRKKKLLARTTTGNSKARLERQRILASLEKSILKGNIKLGKLIEQREKLEAKVIPPNTAMTAKEQAEEYKSFLDRFKTKETRRLEKVHAQRLAEIERQNAGCCATVGLQMLGGWAANATSFFIGNSIARFLAPSIAAPLVSVPLSAFLHVMVAGPVLRQVLDRTWSAPALAEFNNYFKLLGASWGDWARGEENVKKYASKNPDNKEKLTIAERRAEQRPFMELLWDRYKTEEAGYYAYSMNYGFKALAAAGLAARMNVNSPEYRWLEGSMHGLMAWMSGAEYVVAMQAARSQIPGAKQIPLPDRATSAAEAEALRSLRDDLQSNLEKLRNRADKDPTDATERNLLKAIRKTEKALYAADMRSRFLGTLRYEFLAQFASGEVTADTASESIGRTLSLIPAALLSEYLAPWRASGNFWLISAAHSLPGLALIAPPGFTMRPLYSGLLRAMMQAVINGRSATAAQPRPGVPQSSSSGRTPVDADQDEQSIIVEVSSDSDDENWKGNPRESDEDLL